MLDTIRIIKIAGGSTRTNTALHTDVLIHRSLDGLGGESDARGANRVTALVGTARSGQRPPDAGQTNAFQAVGPERMGTLTICAFAERTAKTSSQTELLN